MSDIFISYKREEASAARLLADSLEKKGWSVWWDPKLRAGEHFDDVIEQALHEAQCVVVLWSKQSVRSRYVKDEASYALKRGKLVPVALEEVDLPFRFDGLHTPQLTAWDGSDSFAGFIRIVSDITYLIGPGQKAQDGSTGREGPTPLSVFCDTLSDGREGPQMVVMPLGGFMLGSPADEAERLESEGPQHNVIITTPFALGRYPVTFAEYDAFCQATERKLPADEKWGRGNRPAINVNWQDAQDYCRWLSEESNNHYRLPSEAEWEYAARAGTTTPFWTGQTITTEQANYNGNSTYGEGKNGQFRKKTTPVDLFEANPWGLHDLHGNVWEWVEDCWHENYDHAPKDGSAWLDTDGVDCNLRVLRGGSWFDDPINLRSASRFGSDPGYRNLNFGFRVVCSPSSSTDR